MAFAGDLSKEWRTNTNMGLNLYCDLERQIILSLLIDTEFRLSSLFMTHDLRLTEINQKKVHGIISLWFKPKMMKLLWL